MKFSRGDEKYAEGVIYAGMIYDIIFSVSNLVVFCFEDKNVHSRVYYF